MTRLADSFLCGGVLWHVGQRVRKRLRHDHTGTVTGYSTRDLPHEFFDGPAVGPRDFLHVLPDPHLIRSPELAGRSYSTPVEMLEPIGDLA